ncbi:MAG: LysR family transcriptional regulator [Bosea sp.]|jgi:DNA-binding transcriptional LysR family regulator|uniref:LysR family transcriptional regulator n=1 Tax=Bosea sp. (in: a-proteobacteria) TaxID=1871050 RepID=UPI00086943C8|nr:LysR family transcriptional regulator [Bosea sp. (in: a-proteobacteria)]MBN9468477.1 LysR family transcriptional regulator [Bosea sp. (in: a-proteobacteria)]ODT53595.1 MAG: LysR family transcriptional regulator [Methylobacterium sp. SCN 67-24]
MAALRGLEALRAFVETGTVSRAAARLGRTQPQIGRLLSALESELGFQLFDRQNKRLSLTAEGREFYQHAERLLQGHDGLERFAAQLRRGGRHHIRVLAAPHVAEAIVIDAVAKLSRSDPRFTASVDSRVRIDIDSWLGQEHFDLAVTVLPISHAGFETEEFLRIEAVAAMADSHPLARLEAVTVADLAKTSFIATHRRSLIQKEIERQADEAGVAPESRFETQSGMIACQLAARGLGCCVADPFVAHSSGAPGLVFRPFRPAIELRYGFVFPAWQSRSRLARELSGAIAEQAKALWSAIRTSFG